MPLTDLLPPIRLTELIDRLPIVASYAVDDRQITGVQYDSRKIQPGDIFVAIPGLTSDGHQYIMDAIRRGASAVVGSYDSTDLEVPYIQTPNSRYALAILSAALNGFPARDMTMIGITGTDGKTTVANLIYHLLTLGGIPTGMISTVSAVIGDQKINTGFHVTTPEAPDIQRYLRMMREAGLKVVILEATSHGLDQNRVSGCDFDIGVITNITHEHLDYHQSFTAYREAKAGLFRMLAESPPKSHRPPRAAILNIDDDSYPYLASITQQEIISYGLQGEADITAENLDYHPDGMYFEVKVRNERGLWQSFPIRTRLVGEYNVSNCLAAISVGARLFHLDPQAIQTALANFSGVAGRMERVLIECPPEKAPRFFAIVDFAHTPNALRRSLESARKMTRGRVITVFGSAGLRDRAKRRMMAETSIQLADFTVLTAEDPRTETLVNILNEMAEGARSQGGVEGENFWRIPDRGEAIRYAVNLARDGDLVIACGKGHEQSMCFGEIEYPWDDRIAMQAALAERFGVTGPQMPYLPTQD